MDWFVDNYVPDAAQRADWRASPLLAPALEGVAPAFVLTAGHDVLHRDGMAYAARLEQAGVAVTRRDYPGQLHHFLALPHALPMALLALSDLAEYLVAELRGVAVA
jgi:acetyl esterase